MTGKLSVTPTGTNLHGTILVPMRLVPSWHHGGTDAFGTTPVPVDLVVLSWYRTSTDAPGTTPVAMYLIIHWHDASTSILVVPVSR